PAGRLAPPRARFVRQAVVQRNGLPLFFWRAAPSLAAPPRASLCRSLREPSFALQNSFVDKTGSVNSFFYVGGSGKSLLRLASQPSEPEGDGGEGTEQPKDARGAAR